MSFLAFVFFAAIFCKVFDLVLGLIAAALFARGLLATEQTERGLRESAKLFSPFSLTVTLGYLSRALAIGVAVAMNARVDPSRWWLLWLLAGIAVAQPGAGQPQGPEQQLVLLVGQALIAGAVLLGAAFPGAMPSPMVWLAAQLVF
jgi:hypothetical protein